MDTILVLRDGTVIDGTGRAPVPGATVIVRGPTVEQVLSIGEDLPPLSPEAQVLDCRDKFVLPGLVDAHVHLAFCAGPDHATTIDQLMKDTDSMLALRELRNAQACLLAGITTVRDCGDRHNTTFAARDAIKEGLLAGPRILASGMPLTTTFGHLHFCGLEVEGVEGLRVAVRRQAKAGADQIKVMATGGMMTGNARPLLCQYRQEELDAIGEEARRLDKRVAAHVASAEGIRRCVQAGFNTIEHCGWANPDGASGYDPYLAEQMAEKGVFVGCAIAGINRHWLVPEDKTEEAERQQALDQLHRNWARFREMRAMGVQFCPSTDAGVRMTPFSDIYLSLEFYSMMMEAPPLETLAAATLTSAQALGVDKSVGSIEPGKQADLLILDADPLQDLRNARRVNTVIARGKVAAAAGRLSS